MEPDLRSDRRYIDLAQFREDLHALREETEERGMPWSLQRRCEDLLTVTYQVEKAREQS